MRDKDDLSDSDNGGAIMAILFVIGLIVFVEVFLR